MSLKLNKLLADRGELIDEMTALTEGEGDFDAQKFQELQSKCLEYDKQIEAIEAARKAQAALAKPRAPGAEEQPEQKAFSDFGAFLQRVAHAGMQKGGAGERNFDHRLVWRAATGAGESVPSDGGFLVQTDFRTDLMSRMNDTGDVLRLVTRLPVSANANGAKLPAIDETSRVNGSRWGGVNAYWRDEGATAPASRPKFRTIELNLKKLLAFMYASDELLADTALLGAVARQAFAEELTFKGEEAIIRGTGAGQPLGILNSGAVISITPESGQGATSWRTQNILDMWSAMPRRGRSTAVWLINQEIEPQLYPLTIGSGTAVSALYFAPGTQLNATTNGRLLGRPVIPIEQCSALGTAGDMILADLSDYILIEKGGVQADESMHVNFLYDEMTFRFIWRIDGQPATRTPLTPYLGSRTQSPYVVLAGNR